MKTKVNQWNKIYETLDQEKSFKIKEELLKSLIDTKIIEEKRETSDFAFEPLQKDKKIKTYYVVYSFCKKDTDFLKILEIIWKNG
ncbi:hypothetical protein JTY60_01935 [symbiont of Argiope bruennichi]|uniref:hypothetical protein n=1 Tax=symbiont of Argiope bruennichi TaxID=2810479 RepID=UPI003DA5F3FB